MHTEASATEGLCPRGLCCSGRKGLACAERCCRRGGWRLRCQVAAGQEVQHLLRFGLLVVACRATVVPLFRFAVHLDQGATAQAGEMTSP
jgi:hypothetical protein